MLVGGRQINVSKKYPWRQDALGNRLCALCGKPISSKSRKYCSKICQDTVYIECEPHFAHAKVRRRDKCVCAICGCDTRKLERIMRHAQHMMEPWRGWRELRAIRRAMGFTCAHYWEMDHIQPVAEGGGSCGLENLRTLCIPCHRVETAQLRARLAVKKESM